MGITIVLFLFVPFIHGFLLDKLQNGQGQSATSSKCLTMSEFLTEKKVQNAATESIRHDVDHTLALLSSQIQQKFISLDLQLKKNENVNATVKKFNEINERFQSLEEKYNSLQRDYDLLNGKYGLLKNECSSFNISNVQIREEIKHIKTLESIKPLEEIHNLQQTVQSIISQTESLSVNEHARRQDFRALYNMTLDSKSMIDTLEKKITRTNSNILNLETNQSIALQDLENVMNNRIKQSALLENKTNLWLNQQIQENRKKVAVTSCVSTDITYDVGSVIKFQSVKTHIGYNGISSLISTGKFTCEEPGLYYVSVLIVAYSHGGMFNLYLNGRPISRPVYLSHFESKFQYNLNTVTKSEAVDLQVNDTLWVQVTRDQIEADNYGSCLSIVKVR